MRRLHATGRRERFVASGVYRTGEGLQEHWSIHEVGDGAHFIRVDRDGRGCGRRSLLQEALRNAAGSLERVDQQLYGLNERPVARLRCTRFHNAVELELESESGRRSITLPDDGDCLLLMPGILLAGMALSRATGMPQPVDTLRISQVDDGFSWDRRAMRARCESPGGLAKASVELTARTCSWGGCDGTFCLDSHDVALRYEDDRTCIELDRYSRRHD